MLKRNQRLNLIETIDINVKDEDKNTILHHLFQTFSINMELNVEFCQEILKVTERINHHSSININDMNKNG
jgi:hypothetical protein